MKVLERIKKSTIFIYTGVFLILILLFLALFFINNKIVMWDVDGIKQHFSILYNYNQVLRSFINNPSNGIPQWSWTIGYGSDLLGTYAYYVLGDLFDYISLLFPLSKLEYIYVLLIVFRLYIAGLAFMFYAKKMRFSKKARILGSISYAFSGFVMMSAIRHPYFINPLIILPLSFICIDNVLENRKKYFFSIIVAIAMISNFYFFYMISIISIIYAFFRYFEYKKIQEVKFGKYLLNLIVYFIIGILISCAILLPVLYSIITSSRISSGNTDTTIMFYPIQYYFNLIYSFISSGSYPFWSIVTSPILVFIFLPIFIKNKEKYSTYFYMTIIFFIMLLFPIAGLIMNGFASVSNRWTLVFSFIQSLIICIGFDDLKGITKKDILWMFYIIIFFGILGFIKIGFPEIKNNIFPILFLGAVTLGLIVYNLIDNNIKNIRKNKKIFILILVSLCINIYFNNYYRYSPYGDNYIEEFLEKDNALDYYNKAFDGAEQEIKNLDSGFYRISKTDDISSSKTRNNSLILNYNGIDSYLSVNNGYLAEFSNILNNRSFDPNSPIRNFDNRSIVNNIMGVKYFIGKKEKNPHFNPNIKKVKDVGNYVIYKNYDVLPFGYVYKNILDEKKFDKLNGLEKEQSLLYAASVNNEYRQENINNIPNKINNIHFNTKGSTAKLVKNKIIVTKPNQKVILNITDNTIPAGEIYVNIDNIKLNPFSKNEIINKKAKKIKTTKIDRLLFKLKENILTGTYKGDGYILNVKYNDVSKNFKQTDSLSTTMYFNMNANLINLGYYPKQKNNNQTIILEFDTPGEYTYNSINILNLPINEYKKDINNLKDNSMKLNSISNDKVTGTIDSKVDGIITFQIPYSKGWTLKIDGKETKTFPVNKAFLGANLNKGNHSIELIYKTPFLRVGAVCSFVGIILLIIISFLDKKKFYKK